MRVFSVYIFLFQIFQFVRIRLSLLVIVCRELYSKAVFGMHEHLRNLFVWAQKKIVYALSSYRKGVGCAFMRRASVYDSTYFIDVTRLPVERQIYFDDSVNQAQRPV